jgi:hypothetical protein
VSQPRRDRRRHGGLRTLCADRAKCKLANRLRLSLAIAKLMPPKRAHCSQQNPKAIAIGAATAVKSRRLEQVVQFVDSRLDQSNDGRMAVFSMALEPSRWRFLHARPWLGLLRNSLMTQARARLTAFTILSGLIAGNGWIWAATALRFRCESAR